MAAPTNSIKYAIAACMSQHLRAERYASFTYDEIKLYTLPEFFEYKYHALQCGLCVS